MAGDAVARRFTLEVHAVEAVVRVRRRGVTGGVGADEVANDRVVERGGVVRDLDAFAVVARYEVRSSKPVPPTSVYCVPVLMSMPWYFAPRRSLPVGSSPVMLFWIVVYAVG